jgi:predicted Abi (CAAX) family protease
MIWRTLATNVRGAAVTIPNRQAWQRCALVYALFLVCSLPIGLLSGLLHPGLARLAPAAAALTIITRLGHPACTEELIFRVLMLPRRADRLSRGSLYARVSIALIVFVAAHPLNARLFWPASLALFANPYYLGLAALLGLACSAAYLISGSIWPSILIHWISIVLWILLLGGQALLDSYR